MPFELDAPEAPMGLSGISKDYTEDLNHTISTIPY